MSTEIVAHVLDAIPFELDMTALLKRARVKEGSDNAKDLTRLALEGAKLARPRAMYLVAYVSGRGDNYVEVEGRRFDSRVLSVNMEKTHRVFPYLVTCGEELQVWGEGIGDMLERYWAEMVKEFALGAAINALNEHLENHYQPGETSSMNPGSLTDWPIEQQRVLFDLFGDHRKTLGVTLTDSLLMIPTKTVSGLRFPTGEHFESCQLCPRDNCPGRRAPYEPALFQNRYDL